MAGNRVWHPRAAAAELVRPPPPVTAGEVTGPVRVHDLPGWLFIGWCYLSSALMVVVFIYALFTEPFLQNRVWMAMLIAIAVGVLHWQLAGKVRRCSPLGWYGAMLELAGAVLAKVGMFGIGGLLIGFVELLWMWYFWKRRAQFGVDLGG